jgi:D-alanyl-D-alanine endopeptidase (penicillin-binding protein 7)
MQRKLHPLEGIVAVFALFFVLALSVGFAQAEEAFKHIKQDSRPDTKQEAARQVKAVFLRSSSAMVFDTSTGEVVIDKNANAVVPIASITKLMTAIVILDRGLDLEQRVVVSREDIDTRKGSSSRLRSGGSLKRSELLLLALMASENRAAAALGRTYPGGLPAFVAAMNEKAMQLGMSDSRFVDPTGLSAGNVSSARDLVKLVAAAYEYPLIREYSTKEYATVRLSGRPMNFRNTNGLVRNSHWNIELSKTGYISEAGRCLVMFVHLASKDVIVVLLDSWGKQSRIGDANRIRKWLETTAAAAPRS